MILTQEQVKNYPDGTAMTVFLSGSEWDDDFGRSYTVVKYGDRLVKTSDWFSINEMNNDEGYEFNVAVRR